MDIPTLKAIESFIFSMTFAFLLTSAAMMEREWRITVPNWLCLAGDASYSIYLVHISFQIIFLKTAMRYGALQSIGPQLTYLLILISSIACGIAAFLCIERPMLSQFKKWRHKSDHHPA
ncbi:MULTISPECIES: hypothetical protein [unclassified Janthinobacterium]|uniref:hypothetical protein n=1 Tax=unclassified Janthinobacterium TaxID=2610881 RepID=UPI00088C9194|nr:MULTISPECIES: hypothetical protein [unclassified Janthinobacterium]SDA81993.1 hypothetical protein SAMN03159349_04906 [Janthinobacterium sp. 551a]SFB64672.1 hypothetical protein SAMN03159300_112152 [Janthinobacterium sp. 344]